MRAANCPAIDILRDYLDDRLPVAESEGVEAHVRFCEGCSDSLKGLTEYPGPWGMHEPGPNGQPGRVPPQTAGDPFGADSCPVRDAEDGRRTGRVAVARPHLLDPPEHEGDRGRLGRFRILEELGRGGQAVVLRAIDPDLDREVAIKVLFEEGMPAASRARSLREARAAAGIAHDHVVAVYEVQCPAEGPAVIVMEYVPGMSLEARIAGAGALAPEEAARIAREAALGLAAAHERVLVHRDVKPANILLDRRNGRARVCDFGLARSTSISATLSRTGVIAGTPAYLSPEQITAPDRVDPRADVYGLGVTLYQMLTGEVPFRGTLPRVIRQILDDDARPPRQLNESVPVDLETICLKCLEKAPHRRYATAACLAEDLRRFLAREPIQARPVGATGRAWRWCQRKPVVAVLSASLAAVVAVGFLLVSLQSRRAEIQRLAAERERDRAQRYLARSQEAVDTMLARVSDQLRDIPHMAVMRRDLLERAIAFYQGFLRERGDDVVVRRTAAVAYQKIGSLRELLGQSAEADQAFRESSRISASLLGEFPDDPTLILEYVRVETVLGLSQVAKRSFPEAEMALARAEARLGAIPPNSRDEASVRLGRANLLSARGNLAQEQFRYPDAAGRYRQAIAILEPMVDRETGAFAADLAKQYNGLAIALTRQGDGSGAESAYGDAIALMEPVVLRDPANVFFKTGLGISYRNQAKLLRELRRYPESEARYQKARAIFEGLVRDFPEAPLMRSSLGEVLQGHALMLDQTGRTGEARPLLEQAREEARKARELDPGSPGLRPLHFNKSVTLADMHLRDENYPEAARLVSEFHPDCARTIDFLKAAAILAECVTLASEDAGLAESRREELIRQYSEQATAILRRGFATNYSLNAEELAREPSLAPLRSFEGFNLLLGEIKAAKRGD